jgi:hypothetical protein
MANTAALSAKALTGRINIINTAAMRSAKSKPFEDIGNKLVASGSLKPKPSNNKNNNNNNIEKEEDLLQIKEQCKTIKANLNDCKALIIPSEAGNNSMMKILCMSIAKNRLEDELCQRFKYQFRLDNQIKDGEECVIDIDKFDYDKPTMVADYVKDIFSYMSSLEV